MPATPRVASFATFPPLALEPTSRVFVLTGAGISAESGIRTFRDAGGIWERYRFEEVASPEAWAADPALVWRFYSERRAQADTVHPNAAHHALAAAARALGDRLFLCTQNVDPLHEQAGTPQVVHMHGELFKSRCERDHAPPFEDHAQYLSLAAIPRCACGGRLRPHICWFGETPFEMDRIVAALDAADLFVTIGSSGAVYPAAGFVAHACRRGARTVYVGPETPENANMFDECRIGATQAVPNLFAATAVSS